MKFKSFVTFVRDFDFERTALETAVAMADAQNGHLTVVCLGIDRTQPGAYYAGANAIALQQTLSEAQDAAKEAERKVRDALGAWQTSWETVTVTTQIGAIGSLVADFTRLSDLAVVPKPYGEDRNVEDVAIVEGALFGSRTPVLVLPRDHVGVVAPKKIVIAWNESLEALTAIRGAMPFLEAAGKANIAIIDPPSHGADRSDPGGALAAMLHRHGIKADISVLAKTMPRVSDVICRHVRDMDADMIVMGGYGHSRFREALLGGATRNMLEIAEVPVLMAH